MYLGIEIGGTKLQLGVGTGEEPRLIALERRDIDAARGAAGIREQILEAGRLLLDCHDIQRIGIGFGGPVFGDRGLVQTSHQISGWDQFPLTDWCREQLGKPAALGNDCDVAALAEACFGAGRDSQSLFYVTVGTGIGGGFVQNRRIHGTNRPAAAEIGHLRPGLDCTDPHDTIESRAAGPAIAAKVRKILAESAPSPSHEDLLARCGGNTSQLTTRHIAEAANAGNSLAINAYRQAARVLGWGLAQMTTLLAPEVIVVGGGVSLAGDEVFFNPLRSAIAEYVFRPLRDSVAIVPAALGEEVVVHGAVALARESNR